jgi:hypothetical protein
VFGHSIPQMTYGVYSTGPGLKRLAAAVEAIKISGLEASDGEVTGHQGRAAC